MGTLPAAQGKNPEKKKISWKNKYKIPLGWICGHV